MGTSFPVSILVSVLVQLRPIVSGIGRQNGIGLTLVMKAKTPQQGMSLLAAIASMR